MNDEVKTLRKKLELCEAILSKEAGCEYCVRYSAPEGECDCKCKFEMDYSKFIKGE